MEFALSLSLRKHLVRDHCIAEWEADEEVLKSWIHRKMLLPGENISDSCVLTCCWCEQTFNTFPNYGGHLYQKHYYKSYEKYCKIVEDFKTNISCRLCGVNFEKVNSLEEHLKSTHSKEAIRVCRLCDETCNGKAALFRHVTHHLMGVQCCPICPCKYSTQRQFTSHLESFHENKYSIKCTQCLQSFKNYALYEIHQNNKHNDKEKLNKSFGVKFGFEIEALVSVLKSDDGENTAFQGILCSTCNLTFNHRTQYERHLYSSHPSEFQFRCEECECLFKQFGDFISHQSSHIFGSHRCPHCHVKFSKIDQIKKHLSFSHPFVKGLECKLCIKIFKTYDTYINHLKLKHPEASGSTITYIDCPICHKNFSNNYQFYLHRRIHNNVSSSCNICGMNVKNLSSHMNSHTKSVSYLCKECGFSYINKSSLNAHLKRNHMGDRAKQHRCPKCTKAFISSSDLRAHMSRVHQGERKFACKFCQKVYKNKVTLTYHLRKHTGQKPHECTLCSMAFETPTLLKHHLKRDHNATYKGIYFKRNSQLNFYKGRERSEESTAVHINVPSDMRKEVVSTLYQEELKEGILVEINS